MCFSIDTQASGLTYEFNDSSFSGAGWSTHVLSVEQIEAQRKQKK